MAQYTRLEAREWARENLKGMCNVVIPSFSSDLTRLNEKGIRHDVRKSIEYGFTGTLLVSETATTFEEYLQFTEWAADEAKGRIQLVLHASFNTLEENIRAAKEVEARGAELVLLSYPANFYPKNENEIFEYTRKFAESTNLGIVLFPVPLWGFERLHPAGMSPNLVRRIVKEIPNIVAIKAEQAMPLIGGFVQCYHEFGKEIVITNPLEAEGLPLGTLVPVQWYGTSNYEMYGDLMPKLFKLIQEKKFEEFFDHYWRIHPARQAHQQVMATSSGASFVNRSVWKYQQWLNGFNGGPLRQPTMKINSRQMNQIRAGHRAAGNPITEEDDSLYFIGRNPM